MSPLYTFIVITLGVLAIFDIIVGVSNDAVNFLNSAFGSKITKRKIILTIAAAGVLIGTLTSSGMMEIARSGVFYPEQFSFHEIMVLFLGMIIGDIILLDIFNTLGLPTSTTVSMVFGLLGAAVGITIHKISTIETISAGDLSNYINSGKAMAIISAILLSVVLAFVFGLLFMYISRLLFSFRYSKAFSKAGAIWCGLSVTGIIYYTVFKGLKSSGIIPTGFFDFMHTHTFLTLSTIWIISSTILFVFQKLKVNILKITILMGTFALALAFAGNDLVNFIGVSLAGFDSYKIASEAGTTEITMGALNQPVSANIYILLLAGIVMVLTLFFSKKAMKVTQTELSLSSQNEGEEHFGSSKISRGLVRAALNLNQFYKTVLPKTLREKIERRFEQLPPEERGNVMYDNIRATVNLTAASILISLATSLKLPLSTTYVVFMVAMGSSLADRAWGRESAVYRITGVFTVIAGWFITGFAAFTIALLTTSIMIWVGTVGIIGTVVLCTALIIHNLIKARHNETMSSEEKQKEIEIENSTDVMYNCTEEVIGTMEKINKIYNRTLIAVFKENRKVLKEMMEESKEMLDDARTRKYGIFVTLEKLKKYNINTGHFFVQVQDYLSEVTKAMYHIAKPAYDHIENNHEGLSKAQIIDLMEINDGVEEIFKKINYMLKSRDFSELDTILGMRDKLFDTIAEAIKKQLQRINDESVRTPHRGTVLYLDMLSETKTMILQARNLIKSQKYFLTMNNQEEEINDASVSIDQVQFSQD